MRFLSQNKKIFISALSIFIVSFTILLFFMESKGSDLDFAHGNVMQLSAESHSTADQNHKIDTSHGAINAKMAIAKPLMYEDYLENTDDTWLVTDSTGVIKDGSETFFELLGVARGDAVEKLIYSFINSDDLPEMIQHNSKIIQDASEVRGIGPFRFALDDENDLLVMFNAFPIQEDKEQKVNKILFSVKNITEVVDTMIEDKVEKEIEKEFDKKLNEEKEKWEKDDKITHDENDDEEMENYVDEEKNKDKVSSKKDKSDIENYSDEEKNEDEADKKDKSIKENYSDEEVWDNEKDEKDEHTKFENSALVEGEMADISDREKTTKAKKIKEEPLSAKG